MAIANLILVNSPLLGASSWAPTASALLAQDYAVHVPVVEADMAWRNWPARLAALSPKDSPLVLIGHSASGLLVPALATLVNAHGLIFVDARVPPASGGVAPAEDGFLEFIRTLPIEDARLPPWSRWWGPNAIARLFADRSGFAAFEADLPRLPSNWFGDHIAVAPWAHIPAGYIQTSSSYMAEADGAVQRGWPVLRLNGTHLHPLLAPEETAEAIIEIARRLA